MRKDFGAKTWLYPQPVLIIATYDENGNADAMNAAWGGVYDSNQIVLCLSEGHKTYKNIMLRKAFTVSMATANTVVPCDYVGIVSANKEPEKLAKAGFTTIKSDTVDAPIINELPMTLECKFIKCNEDGNVIGEIVNISADESILDENGSIDPAKLQPICFDSVTMSYHVLGEKVGNAFADGKKLM